MKPISRETILQIAAGPNGFMVHKYKWGHDQKRKLCNRMVAELLLERRVWGDQLVYKAIPHNPKCDVNPKDLTWKRAIADGENAMVCASCAIRVQAKKGKKK